MSEVELHGVKKRFGELLGPLPTLLCCVAVKLADRFQCSPSEQGSQVTD